MKKLSGLYVYCCLVFAMLVWSMTFIWYKYVFEVLGPVSTIIIRLTISDIVLFSFLIITKKGLSIDKKDIIRFLLLAFFEPFLYYVGESLGVSRVSSTLTAVIISTIPIFLLLSGTIFLNEKIKPMNAIGIFISFTGVGLLILETKITISGTFVGILYLFLGVFSAVAYTYLVKNLSLKYKPITIVSYQNLFGMIFFLPLFIFLEAGSFPGLMALREVWVTLLKMALLASTLAFLAYTFGVSKFGVAKAGLFTNLIPVFTTLFAIQFLNEYMNAQKITGIVLTTIGLFVSNVNPRKIRY